MNATRIGVFGKVYAKAGAIAFAALFAAAAQAGDAVESPTYALLGPAFSYHQQRTQTQTFPDGSFIARSYNESNIGLGIEQRNPLPSSAWELALGVTALRDSFYQPSLFASANLTRPVLSGLGLQLRVGVAAGAAYKYMRWAGPRLAVPFAAATAEIRHEGTGLGARLNFIPRTNASTGRSAGLFLLQTSFAL